jgi:hypothetical protein
MSARGMRLPRTKVQPLLEFNSGVADTAVLMLMRGVCPTQLAPLWDCPASLRVSPIWTAIPVGWPITKPHPNGQYACR